jgi:hypothetical protein
MDLKPFPGGSGFFIDGFPFTADAEDAEDFLSFAFR